MKTENAALILLELAVGIVAGMVVFTYVAPMLSKNSNTPTA